MDTSPTGERRQRRIPGGRTERIVVRVDPDTWSHLKCQAATAGRSLPAYLVEAGLRPLLAGTSGMSLAGQRAMAEQLDTVLTRLRQSGNLPHWDVAQQALVEVTKDLERLDSGDSDRWTQHVGHAADLVAVLSHRLELEPGPLYRAGHHLARAAQPGRSCYHAPACPGSGRPILLDVARLVAGSRDPAQAATMATVVLMAYGLVRLLDHLATRHATDLAQRRQLHLAGIRLAEHLDITSDPATRAARQATARSRQPINEADHLHRTRRDQPIRPAGRSR